MLWGLIFDFSSLFVIYPKLTEWLVHSWVNIQIMWADDELDAK